MHFTEGIIHCAVRRGLKTFGWRLIAGQYPGGSDDELHTLNIMDPELAGDNCPDPSRHSENKLVPDLVALKCGLLLIVEMKPRYSLGDKEKLITTLSERRNDLLLALRTFAEDRSIIEVARPEALLLVPALGFGHKSRFVRDPSFCYLLVHSLEEMTITPPEALRDHGAFKDREKDNANNR